METTNLGEADGPPAIEWSEIAALWADRGWPAQPADSGSGITAPSNAPTLGPPPWFVWRF